MSSIPRRLRIATRESRLALRQAGMVAAAIHARHATLEVETVGMSTRGDQVLDRPLAQVGGKGLFVKELEIALDEGRADIAVHSLKDVPMRIPEQFALTTFGAREDPRDAFVSNRFGSPAELPAGAVVGTSSVRRECQLRSLYPGLVFRALRGNVNTRLAKLDAGDYDAIILATAGLRRLGLDARVRATLDETIPAIGQGVLAVEYRRDRDDLALLMADFELDATACAARAERALGLAVEGSCDVPVGALARVDGARISIEGFIGMPDGTRIVRASAAGQCEDAQSLGAELGASLLAAGGREILMSLVGASA